MKNSLFSCERKRFYKTLRIFGVPFQMFRKNFKVSIENELDETIRQRAATRDFVYPILAANERRLFSLAAWSEEERERSFFTAFETSDVVGRENDCLRLGGPSDGGYVMLDAFQKGGVAYSFGVRDDVAWDEELAKRGYDVYLYDHTIDALPKENERFHFFKTGIRGAAPVEDCETLGALIEANGHADRDDMILKIDVEGAEWDVLEEVDERLAARFAQIAIEFHFDLGTEDWTRYRRALDKLNRTHAPIWVHANNCGGVRLVDGECRYEALEACYVRRSDFELKPSTKIFPTQWDAPNDPSRPDYFLGRWV